MPKKPGSPEASTTPPVSTSSRSVASRSLPSTTCCLPGASCCSTARPPATTLAASSSGSVPGGTAPPETPRTWISGTFLVLARRAETPVAMAVVRVVDVRLAGARAAAQRGADEHERLRRDLLLADARADLVQSAAEHDLVRPARLVDDRGGRVGRVAAVDQVLLELARAADREEQRHRRAVRGHRLQLLVGRHRGPLRAAGDDQRLAHVGDRQLLPEARGRGGERGHARDD